MKTPIIYTKTFIKNPDEVFESLLNELDWEKRGETPRKEYYSNDYGIPYIYGRGRGVREYLSKPWHEEMKKIQANLKELTGFDLEVCFLNLYEDSKDHIGWHADDSPEMDDERPIAVISLGSEREMWFRSKDNKFEVEKITLEHGSLCLMLPGMQETHFHRIPKSSFECKKRISLTYRGFVL